MKVAPIDIAHKTFDRKINGLDTQEVYAFLRDVADQMEEVVRERNQLKEQLREKELQIMEYRERDETLKATITTATRMAEQMRVESEKEGHLIAQDARHKAEIIVRDARDSLRKTYQEIADLKRARMQFETNLRSVLQAHVSMLDQGRIFMKDPHIELPNELNERAQQFGLPSQQNQPMQQPMGQMPQQQMPQQMQQQMAQNQQQMQQPQVMHAGPTVSVKRASSNSGPIITQAAPLEMK